MWLLSALKIVKCESCTHSHPKDKNNILVDWLISVQLSRVYFSPQQCGRCKDKRQSCSCYLPSRQPLRHLKHSRSLRDRRNWRRLRTVLRSAWGSYSHPCAPANKPRSWQESISCFLSQITFDNHPPNCFFKIKCCNSLLGWNTQAVQSSRQEKWESACFRGKRKECHRGNKKDLF